LVKIDLHGLKYSEVEETLANLLINQYNLGNKDFEIITGNSEQMKSLVEIICKDYGFRVEKSFNKNSGSLIVSSIEI
tara:strand:+ start:441 stop:671 length:231 start_codon:yes stop_codon:yes gene_type:complete